MNIKTPDQRLRVFVSSTLKELSEERKAARSAIETFHLIPVMFELGARPHPPKDLYQAYLRQSHIFIGIYWQSYGWIAENEKISGLEDELLLSENFPRLIYVKEPAPQRQDKLSQMLDFIRSRGNVSYKSFATAEELSKIIIDDLAILISERFNNPDNISEESDAHCRNDIPVHMPKLIGREKEISEICHNILENKSSLVTITGPGGIGKTLLSFTVGKNLEKHFTDGIYVAEFSNIMEENDVGKVLAGLFGISVNSSDDISVQISEYISVQKILLIIDNFEQLTNSGSLISDIVKKCPNLAVIVTSRNPLELSVETEYNLDALSYPDESYDMNEIKLSPSVKLFCERALSANKNFELNKENIFTVSEICRLLGGIPLALELAAVKIRMFTPEIIRDRLSKKLDFLSGGKKDSPARHKTMKAALEWSYDLLNENEKKLFRRLSVFENSFDYEAVEYICCFDISDAAEITESLLIKNFFSKDNRIKDSVRFRIPELIRKYSEELLEQSGETEKIKLHLADYYLKNVKEESQDYYGAIEARISSRWEMDILNVMNAMETLQNHNRQKDLIEMIYSLWPVFWIFNNDNILVKRIDLKTLLKYDQEISDELKGKINWLEGSEAMEAGDLKTAAIKFNTASDYFSRTDNIRGTAWTNLLINSLKNNNSKSISGSEIPDAFKLSAELFRKCRDNWGESVAIQYSAAFEMSRGNYTEAIKLYENCRTLINKMGSESLQGYILSMNAWAYIELKRYDKAAELLKEATEILNKGKMDEGIAYCLQIITYYFLRTNDYNNAMFVAGLCRNIFSKYNFAPWHMLSELFRYIDDKIVSLIDQGQSEFFQKGMSINIFKSSDFAFRLFHDSQGKN